MKNIVRALVLVLTISGSVAYTQINASASKHAVVTSKVNSMPIPMCPPDDPNACGIGK